MPTKTSATASRTVTIRLHSIFFFRFFRRPTRHSTTAMITKRTASRIAISSLALPTSMIMSDVPLFVFLPLFYNGQGPCATVARSGMKRLMYTVCSCKMFVKAKNEKPEAEKLNL